MDTNKETPAWQPQANQTDRGTKVRTSNLETDLGSSNGTNHAVKIPRSALLQILHGVAVAAKTSDSEIAPVSLWFSSPDAPLSHNTNPETERDDNATIGALSFRDWHAAIVTSHSLQVQARQLALLTLSISFLREKVRKAPDDAVAAVNGNDLAQIWDLIHSALTDPLLPRPLCSASRSAQGFLAVPICSLLKDGHIDELFRLHVWLPDGQRGNSESIHSHQPFAQSWILAGEGTDHSYQVDSANDLASATHAEYALSWSDAKGSGTAYKTHQTESTIVNTGALVRTTPKDSAVHARNASYVIPAAAFHRSEIQPDAFHATLFLFDSHRGFVEDARVLGPKYGKSFTQRRDPAGITPTALAHMVEAVRSWETSMDRGRQYAQRAEWEYALQAYNTALVLCETTEDFPNAMHYRRLVLGGLGNTNRRFGRYEHARAILEEAIADMGPSLRRVKLSGELGVVHRHMGRLSDAQQAFEQQYDTAKELENELSMCRAVGNLGMVNYQLFQRDHDLVLLDLAIDQLNERVRIARQIKEPARTEETNSSPEPHWIKLATIWETIGLARLSLAYTARGDLPKAIAAAAESLEITSGSEDSTVTAMTRFFYGRALLLAGKKDEAAQQFNPSKTCTPAMAFCKEPSEEHRQYLRELVDARANMELEDEQGYTALDYAIFNNDAGTESLILEGLRQRFDRSVEEKVAQRHMESRLRKGYRELFQEKLRPVLLSSRQVGKGLHNLRYAYANALAADEEKRKLFDELKIMRYVEFLQVGKLPRSDERIAKRFELELEGARYSSVIDFIIFFSYRWINTLRETSSPDDAENTQYRRMVDAVEEFLQLHSSVNRETLGIWVDFSCVDQDNPSSGVSALPMIITQCNAVISLLDKDYYARAWCSVEAMVAQTLRRSHGLHLWYEQVLPSPDVTMGRAGKRWILREAPMDLEISMAEKLLSFEEDRPKVLFLERQSKLLG